MKVEIKKISIKDVFFSVFPLAVFVLMLMRMISLFSTSISTTIHQLRLHIRANTTLMFTTRVQAFLLLI